MKTKTVIALTVASLLGTTRGALAGDARATWLAQINKAQLLAADHLTASAKQNLESCLRQATIPKERYIALKLLARLAEQSHDIDTAVSLYQQALAIPDEQRLPVSAIDVSGHLAELLRKKGQTTQATALDERAKAERAKGNDGNDYSQPLREASLAVKRNWSPPKLTQARVVAMWTVDTIGNVNNMYLDQSSGFENADTAALQAVTRATPLPIHPTKEIAMNFTFDIGEATPKKAVAGTRLNGQPWHSRDGTVTDWDQLEKDISVEVDNAQKFSSSDKLARLLLRRGQIYMSRNKFPQAQADFEHGVTLSVGDIQADLLRAAILAKLGEAKFEQRDFAGADSAFEQSLRLAELIKMTASDRIAIMQPYAKMLYKQGSIDKANQIYAQVKALLDGKAVPPLTMNSTTLDVNTPAKPLSPNANAPAKPLIIRSAGHWADLFNAAALDWAQSKFDQAEEGFKKSIDAADPKDPRQARWSYAKLGILYASEGKNDEAERALKRLLENDSPGSGILLQRFYHHIGNTAEEDKMIERELKLRKAKKEKETKPPAPTVDFGPYMANVQAVLKRSWLTTKLQQSARVVACWSLDREGHPHSVRVDRSSADADVDQIAIQDVLAVESFGSLPAGSNKEVDIQFTFDWNSREAAKPTALVPADLIGPGESMTDRQLELLLAEHSLSEQLAGERKKTGESSNETMAVAAKLMDCLREERKFAEMQQILDPLLAHSNNAHADASFAQLLRIAGDLALEKQNNIQAESNYQQSIKVAEELGSAGSAQLRESLQAYAKYLYKQGDYHKSNEIYEKIRVMLLK